MGTGSWRDVLSRSQMHGILEVLESCCDVDEPADYKRTVVESIATVFRVRDVTFFFGPTFADIFADPAPLLTGAASPLLHEYHARWRDKDIFALPEARRSLTDNGFISLDHLHALPAPQRSYVEDYLHPHGMGTASALHLRFADGEALVGMFDRERSWDASESLAVQVLARQLRAQGRSMLLSGTGDADAVDPLGSLTPRQMQVAELVSDGLSNNEIAEVLSLSEFTVKKYVSRIFESTGLRNRASLTACVLRRGRRPTV
ncbi:response regulator transcription factor [Rhodococcus pseudokoreensis]|uniref:Response regulator transcription factor n=1 Tax=Rhodococcus pseudokoreensis TaxID=2811421 RepID=A0A974ZUX2_9NOCA|nr:LuxR C-terminal-related transcriptional regulator [Rhodococcus pseudokoreensis]QSE91341.1 response regulator transcription factor [Rhodococcus pseudokoreensis]